MFTFFTSKDMLSTRARRSCDAVPYIFTRVRFPRTSYAYAFHVFAYSFTVESVFTRARGTCNFVAYMRMA